MVGEPVNTPATEQEGQLNAEVLVRLSPVVQGLKGILVSVPITEAIDITVSRLIAKRIDDSSSIMSDTQRRRVSTTIPWVLVLISNACLSCLMPAFARRPAK